MPFISYAQNFEDVMLWRALKLFGPGFYIDVGANHPTRDSVTRSLYERGWRGINIEPVLHYHQALCAERPEDINLCVAVGDKADELKFFESPETGLSTLSVEMAQRQSAEGIAFVPRTVETRTLSSICAEHIGSGVQIHFLKIDVEGFEEQVLRGCDFQEWRPWIVLIESAFDTEPEWVSLLVEAGYRFALCDGINRYYVAEEKRQLLAPLSMPPNFLDEFQLCYGHRFSHPVEADVTSPTAPGEALRRAESAEAQLMAIYGSRLWRLVTLVTQAKRWATGR
jgi:FkbM family methyltransferase